ncbi:MAG: putative Ig domain-containing protein [Candidatus Marinimicrobia bacterium]|nr:putative Ig domain-containing protein [Candidatus Neomarinimicrobiota bacterium]
MMSKHFFSHVAVRHIWFVPLLVILMTSSLWSANGLRDISHLKDLGDLDHDGNNDFGAIRNTKGNGSELIAFEMTPDGNFEVTWRFALPENLVGEWADFTLTDLNLNGRPELVAITKLISAAAGNSAPWVYGFEWSGKDFDYVPTFQWGWTPDNGLYARPTQIIAGDIDNDGLTELIFSLSAPQANLLIVEIKGDLSSSDIQIEYAGLPEEMTRIPSSIMLAINDVNHDHQDDIVVFQKRGAKLSSAGITSSAEDRYKTIDYRDVKLETGAGEIVNTTGIATADLDGSGFEKIYFGSSKGNIYQYSSTGKNKLWSSFSGPINQLSFTELDGDGLTECLIRTGDRVHYLEQNIKDGRYESFSSLIEKEINASNALPFHDGLLLEKSGPYQFMAITPNEQDIVEATDEPEAVTEALSAMEAEATIPDIPEKLLSEPMEEKASAPEIRRKPKAPDVILHVGENFSHAIPRQDEMDPGQAYVKFKTYPEGMRLGKDFILRWNPAKDQLGYHQISYSFGQQLDTTFSLYVNHIPEIFSTPPPLAQTGQQYLYQVQLEDLNQEQYFEFELISAPTGMQVDEEGLVRWLPSDTQLDSQYVTLSVSDGFERVLQKFTLYVNILPVILEKPGPVAFINEPYVGQVSIQDKNSKNSARLIPLRTPKNLILESSGRITWTPEPKQTGFHDILFELTDDMSTMLDSFTIFVNTSPVIISKYDEHVPVGKPWNYKVEVTDPNNNQDISYLLSESSIPNLTISRRGHITWTPTEAELGQQTFTISVSDGLRDDLQKVTVYVNGAPVLGTVSDTLATVARPYTTLLPVTDLNKDQKLNFAFLTAPKGMIISPTGQITWTPTKEQKGWNEVFVKVSDKYSSDTYKFAVYANAPPVIVSKSDTMAIAGQEYTYEIKALDLNTDQKLVYKVYDAPVGVHLVNESIVKWTPKIDQINQAQFKVSVTDGYITNVQNVQLFVNALPEVTSTPSPVVLMDREYRYQMASRDLNEDGIKYTKILLPNGAEMNEAEGLITWVPDGSNDGANKFIIELTDSRGSSSFHEFEVNVFKDPKAPIRQMGAFLITLAGIGAMFIMKFLY